jgi:enterochelin esterase-like enzyme
MTDPIFLEKPAIVDIKKLTISSSLLNRIVSVDVYIPVQLSSSQQPSLLLINDGQNMEELGLNGMLSSLFSAGEIGPLIAIAIHANEERRQEYGTAGVPDFLGRGSKAGLYSLFIFEELLPFLRKITGIGQFKEKIFAGFSLGGLSALDIVWAHPHEFTRVGVFSASLWWRTIDQDHPDYDDNMHRIMHNLIRNGNHAPWLKFFFETGTMDEVNDRNKNGIIDSIDDTLSLIRELENKGYDPEMDIVYLELPDGKHDIATWARAMPDFLRWALGS